MRLPAAIASLLLCASVPSAAAEDVCGWYVVLGCDRSAAAMEKKRAVIAALADDGTTWTKVVDTGDYPNFRDGWYCLVDGPFATRGEAEALDWGETVGETYVKNGC